MKLLLKQYLASLRERDELDIVLPDILSELGFTIISRPMRGTAQYGVDIAALGPHPDTGVPAIYLLSVKSGDLGRDDWDTGKQSLRPSLVDILDVYIPKQLPRRYRKMPKVVALCFGGDIQEDVRPRVGAFIDKYAEAGEIDFVEWNGAYIAGLIGTGLLREHIFPKSFEVNFRKAVALVDEPDVCEAHFRSLIDQIVTPEIKNFSDRIRRARQILVAAWTIFAWCRDAGNLEASYRCTSLSLLAIWHLSHQHIVGKSKYHRALSDVVDKAISLMLTNSGAYLDEHVLPYCEIEDGLAASVPSHSSADINLKLFEALGRLALHGHWLVFQKSLRPSEGESDQEPIAEQLNLCSDRLIKLIKNNPVFYTPLRDDHAIEVNLAALLLLHQGETGFAHDWIEQMTLSSIFSHRSHGYFPCAFREYSDLVEHPKSRENYREDATLGSILYPTLGVWLSIFDDQSAFSALEDFYRNFMPHSTWQLWFPDEATDEHLFLNTDIHGAALPGLTLSDGTAGLLKTLEEEISASNDFANLSAVRIGIWPLVLLACQRHRIPLPPQFWVMNWSPSASEVKS